MRDENLKILLKFIHKIQKVQEGNKNPKTYGQL